MSSYSLHTFCQPSPPLLLTLAPSATKTLAHPHWCLLCDQQAADLIRVTEFHSTLIHPHSGLVVHGGTKTPAPSEAGPHVRLCRFAAGLDEPTLIYGEALPCHPPYTHINPSYSIWQRRKKPRDATLPNLICATFTFLTWSQATRGGQYIRFLFIVFSFFLIPIRTRGEGTYLFIR